MSSGSSGSSSSNNPSPPLPPGELEVADFLAWIGKVMRCSFCLIVPTPDATALCRNGHISCECCSLEYKDCLLCHNPIYPFFSLTFTKIFNASKHPCPNGECLVSPLGKDLMRHLKHCHFRTIITCQQNKVCKKGRIGVNDYAEHLIVEHGFELRHGPTHTYYIGGKDLEHFNPERFTVLALIAYSGEFFGLCVFKEGKHLFAMILQLRTPNALTSEQPIEEDSYVYKLELIDPEYKMRMSCGIARLFSGYRHSLKVGDYVRISQFGKVIPNLVVNVTITCADDPPRLSMQRLPNPATPPQNII